MTKRIVTIKITIVTIKITIVLLSSPPCVSALVIFIVTILLVSTFTIERTILTTEIRKIQDNNSNNDKNKNSNDRKEQL